MPSPRVRFALLLGAALLGSTAHAQAPAKPRDATKIYSDFCAGCHGARMEGGSAPGLLGGTWKRGGDDATLAAAIRSGRGDAGMPAFSATVSEQEIRGLIVYIRETGGRTADSKGTFNRPDETTVSKSKLHSFRLETVVPALNEPWSIAFLPDGRTLITEKRGTLRIVEKGVLVPEPVSGTPKVDSGGQAGLFDVVPHPYFAKNGWIYLSFSDPQKNAKGENVCMTKIVRGRIKDNAWTDQEVIFAAPIANYRNTGGVHYGGRIAFDQKGFLFFSIGERGQGDNAQKLELPNGKIHRVSADGSIPTDNPFFNTPGADKTIWSYGHRNPQGLRLNPVTGDIWEHEHGPRGGDELNLIKRGLNYGWPLATFGMNYNGTPMTDVTGRADFEPPITYWVPSIAPCGMGFYTGDRFPNWKNQLFVTSLAAQELRRLELKDNKVIDQEVIFKGIGRLRDVATGPDGLLYVLLQDRVARLVPAEMK